MSAAASRMPRVKFLLVQGDLRFAPLFPPDKPLAFNKDRNLSRQKSMCEGEEVNDTGAKNREVTVTGIMRERERRIYEDVIDSTDPFLLETNGWGGYVRVESADYKGPHGFDPESNEILWRYNMELVSTGESEYDNFQDSGIID